MYTICENTHIRFKVTIGRVSLASVLPAMFYCCCRVRHIRSDLAMVR